MELGAIVEAATLPCLLLSANQADVILGGVGSRASNMSAATACDALRQGIAKFSRNDLFIVLALPWVFASFLQGTAGSALPSFQVGI